MIGRDGVLTDALVLPSDNTERTYVFEGITEKPDSVSVYPILKDGRACQDSDTLNYISDRVEE